MWKKWTAVAAIGGAKAVVLGALSAHALKGRIGNGMTADTVASFKTGAEYQMLHCIVILVLAISAAKFHPKFLSAALWLFLIGMFLFSGSVYFLSTRDLTGLTGLSWLGPVTPLGGLCFIAGWLFTALAAWKGNPQHT